MHELSILATVYTFYIVQTIQYFLTKFNVSVILQYLN